MLIKTVEDLKLSFRLIPRLRARLSTCSKTSPAQRWSEKNGRQSSKKLAEQEL
jgi:hypothetical protein